MPTTERAASDDPVLSQAISDMTSEGTLQPDQSLDASSQPSTDTSAAPAAAAVPADGAAGRSGTPAVSAPEQADGAPKPGADDDPLAGAEPFTHDVNGEKVALEGVYRVPGEGLLVPENAVPQITRLLEDRAEFQRMSRDYATRDAQTERLSQWQIRGDDGKEQPVSGSMGIAALRLDHARQQAAFATLLSVFEPDAQGRYPRLQALLTASEDGQGITLDAVALEHLKERASAAELRAEVTTQNWIRQAAQAPAPQAAPDYAKVAPQFIDAELQRLKIDGASLTPDDRAALAGQFGRYIRTATEQDRMRDPQIRVGLPMLDAAFGDLIKHTASVRSAGKQQAEAAERAGKHNAGMDKGRQPPAKVAAKPSPVTPPKPANERKKADWDGPLTQALAEMGVPR